jgi:hypothetical protein
MHFSSRKSTLKFSEEWGKSHSFLSAQWGKSFIDMGKESCNGERVPSKLGKSHVLIAFK